MKESVAVEWIAALRSGDHKQTTGALRDSARDDNGEERVAYCCLGVLGHCVLHLYATPSAGTLTMEMMGEAGIKSELGKPDDLDHSDSNVWIDGNSWCDLTVANDAGVPFAKIADWIEQNWRRL